MCVKAFARIYFPKLRNDMWANAKFTCHQNVLCSWSDLDPISRPSPLPSIVLRLGSNVKVKVVDQGS